MTPPITRSLIFSDTSHYSPLSFLGNTISPIVRAVITDITACMAKPFSVPPPPASHYLPVQENFLSFFPSLPVQTGPAHYAADKFLSRHESDECRKYAGCHLVLTPGIFITFCTHGTCYGFKVMATHEFPCHPFQIFRSRFTVAPKLIIYDNDCKLHQYCLNREPAFFGHTQFGVDCFHWHGHIGCSAGYSLDKYRSVAEVRAINSQVNEQANAGLQHIKGQLAYMSADNFMFHFFWQGRT